MDHLLTVSSFLGLRIGSVVVSLFHINLSLNMSTPSSSLKFENHSVLSPSDHSSVEGVLNLVELNTNKPDPFNLAAASEDFCSYAGCLDPAEVSASSISASLVPFYCGTQRMQKLHKDVKLLLCCTQLRVRFGISTKFVDRVRQPWLSFEVDGSPSLCQVLDACGQVVHMSMDSGSRSKWRPVVT
ncbi:hypothetical protein AAG906_001267 [Vitis piasezkii]